MKKIQYNKTLLIFIVLGAVIMIWLGLLFAPALSSDCTLFEKTDMMQLALNKPFSITFNESSTKTALVFLLLYGLALLVVFSSQKNYRKGVEHGSAKWGSISKLRKKLLPNKNENGIVFTQNISLSVKKVFKHRKNLNVLVDGGSGSGKSLFYVVPNLLQANTSYVVLDPKGESLRRTGYFLKQQGYKVKVIDLLNMEKSDGYNPFKYIRPTHVDEDIQKLVTNIFSASTPKNTMQQDPFWDSTASMLLKALMLFLYYEAPPYEQNFAMVNEMLRSARVSESNEDFQSPVDILFEQLRAENPQHTALVYYDLYRGGAAKTLKSIQITLISKIEKFIIPSLEQLTACDELELEKMGEEKTALFAIIPDSDKSFNFLVSILYTQLFQQLFKVADEKYHGALPIQVHFIMDEFANVALPDDFQEILSTMRSRGVNASIIIQNIAQLKKLFEKDWESVIGNCDEFLYLGGNEQSTHKYVSELLGKETIDTNTYGYNKGRNGSYTTNYQISGRELLDASEVRLLSDQEAILFVKGELPVKDRKFDTFHHPDITQTPLKGGEPYEHGEIKNSVASIQATHTNEKDNIPDVIANIDLSDYELLSDEN